MFKVSKVDERIFFQLNNEIVEIKDYKIKSSADGSTELLIVIEGNANVFDLSANLKEKIDRKSTSQPLEKAFSELLRQSDEHPISLKFPEEIENLSKCLKKN